MGKVSKATKHFSKKHLSNEIKTRKLRQKIKFRDKKTWGARKSPEELEAEKKLKIKGHETEDHENEDDDAEDHDAGDDKQPDSPDEYQGNVDEFLEKGFFDALEEDDDEAEDHEVEDEDDDGVEDPKKHKHDLERLKIEQPEFYKYLAENDADLLEFDADEDEESEKEGHENADPTGADGEEDAEDESKATLRVHLTTDAD